MYKLPHNVAISAFICNNVVTEFQGDMTRGSVSMADEDEKCSTPFVGKITFTTQNIIYSQMT